jgi:hypothetical protein
VRTHGQSTQIAGYPSKYAFIKEHRREFDEPGIRVRVPFLIADPFLCLTGDIRQGFEVIETE